MNVLTRVANSLSSFVVMAADRCYHMRYDANERTLNMLGGVDSTCILASVVAWGQRRVWSNGGDARP